MAFDSDGNPQTKGRRFNNPQTFNLFEALLFV
jgi:hypothetical protein